MPGCPKFKALLAEAGGKLSSDYEGALGKFIREKKAARAAAGYALWTASIAIMAWCTARHAWMHENVHVHET